MKSLKIVKALCPRWSVVTDFFPFGIKSWAGRARSQPRERCWNWENIGNVASRGWTWLVTNPVAFFLFETGQLWLQPHESVQIPTGRLIAPDRSFAHKLCLYNSNKRVTASVFNFSCSVCIESNTKVPSWCDFVIESFGFCTLWRVYECHTRLDYYFAQWTDALVFNNTQL